MLSKSPSVLKRTDAAIRALYSCVAVCADGEKRYRSASADALAPGLQSLFARYEAQRTELLNALEWELDGLDAPRMYGGTARGALRRSWTGARLVIEGHKDEILVYECLKAELAALRTYDKVLADADLLSAHVRGLLELQREVIAASLSELQKRLANAGREGVVGGADGN
jgi:uncharacterized protein (TIGR02284 family)